MELGALSGVSCDPTPPYITLLKDLTLPCNILVIPELGWASHNRCRQFNSTSPHTALPVKLTSLRTTPVFPVS